MADADAPPDPQAAALAQLQRRFALGLPARWARIASTDPAERDQALHQLSGAAGAYGLGVLGEAARQAEACATAGDRRGLQAALATLRGALQAEVLRIDTVR